MNPVLDAVRQTRAVVQILTPTCLSTMPTGIESDPGARLLMVDAEHCGRAIEAQDFPADILAKHLRGERVAIISAAPALGHDLFLAALLASGGRLVCVFTVAEGHAHWTKAVTRIAGHAPVIHVAERDTCIGTDDTKTVDLRDIEAAAVH